MIDINKLSFAYKKQNNLFKELDLKIDTGKIYGLLGENGAGKTSLLKLIAGLQYPKSGQITIDSICSRGRVPGYLEKYYFVTEEFYLPSIKIECYVKIHSPFYKNFDHEAFKEYISEFNIPKDNQLSKMSYGQKKKFLISFGLATQSKFLFMDEPTNGLDIPSKSIFRRLIAKNINEDRAFIISTHQVKDIEGLIDGVMVLDNGKVVFNETLEEISRKVQCKTIDLDQTEENIIYSEQTIINQKVIIPNENNLDSPIDIEMIFNAVISNNKAIVEQFKTKNNE